MYRVLFVCLGNICRSCTAEEIFRTLVRKAGLSQDVEADSAGLIDYHQGELPDSRMRRFAAEAGYRLTHRSRPVSPADFSRFDLVVGMDSDNLKRLSRLAPDDSAREKIKGMAGYLTRHPAFTRIPDPYYGGEDDFRLVVELLEDACAALLEEIRENLPSAGNGVQR